MQKLRCYGVFSFRQIVQESENCCIALTKKRSGVTRDILESADTAAKQILGLELMNQKTIAQSPVDADWRELNLF